MKKLLFISCLIVAVTGCATMVYGTKQSVAFETVQGGGKMIVYDDALYGIVSEHETELPAKVELYRKKFYKIDIIHPEYGKKTIRLKPGYNYGDALSNLFVVTMAVDTVTGSSRSFDEKVTIDMEAVE